ncbi:metal ABC transporter ATP-binding protein [Saccharibacter floricola]|nr:ATP-binding cassette domain-containing protein [Saccharibacter floricola]
MTTPCLFGRKLLLQVGPCTVLNDADFDLPLNGITILRGANGVGKTSFLRAILGLTPLQAGTLLLDHKPPKQARHCIGYMPQKAGQQAPMLPVISHVIACIAGQSWGLSWSRAPRREALRLLTITGAVHLADRPLGVLSGGERQRVALAQALAHQPRLLILDEPLAALDPQARDANRILFSELYNRYDIALLMTAHSALEADDFSCPAHEIWLEEGQLHV